MRCLFLIQHPQAASSRYRVLQLLPFLEGSGISGVVEPVPDGLLRRRELLRKCSDFDLVFVQKRLFPGWQIRLLRKRARRLVYDFDDAVMFPPAARRPRSYTRRRRFAAMARAADLLIAGNDYLARQAMQWTAQVIVVPTAIDPHPYDAAAPPPTGSAPVLGWIGSRSTLAYLEGLLPALRLLVSRRPGVRLKVICDAFPEFPFMQVIRCPWSARRETSEVKGIDIGLAPMTHDPWARGKCGFKILQYYAARKPVVGSPVGVQVHMIRHGVTGYHARTATEWVERIGDLLDAPERRSLAGEKGRQLLDAEYRADAVAPRLAEALRLACR